MTLPISRPEPLIDSRTVGRTRVHAIQAGGQLLDGGAMFGVVPRTLWEKRIAPDARNRIAMGMRCLLIEHEDGLVLVDTGLGNKETAKFHEIYGADNAARDGADVGVDTSRTALEVAIARLGYRTEEITLVVNTHLHFDHAGGNTWRNAGGEVRPTFPNARYVVQRGEVEYARAANERTAASYFPANWEPVGTQWELLEGDVDVRSGLSVRVTPGHTPAHQSVLLTSGGETLCFLGDLVPTAHHLPLPWIMGYDVEPLRTLETKRTVLADALAHDWLLVFEHDAQIGFGRLAHDGKSYVLRG